MNLQAHLGELYDQFGEIISRITNGSLDPVAVGQSLQAIIDQSAKGASWLPPAWWRSPKLQLERASQLWPNRQLPKQPNQFVPRTPSEVLLLHVPASFAVLWEIVESPGGYDKISLVDFMDSNQRHLKLTSPRSAHVHPVWVGFDPEHGRDRAPSRFAQRTDMDGCGRSAIGLDSVSGLASILGQGGVPSASDRLSGKSQQLLATYASH